MRRFSLTVTLACVLVLVGAVLPAGAESAPKKTLPRLSDPSAETEVTGRIASSTRGEAGPVRLVLKLEGGKELAVLVAPDSLCDQLGLSLREGDEVTVFGHLMAGARPLLVSRTLMVDGRRVDVRDESGGWAKAPGPVRSPEAKEAP